MNHLKYSWVHYCIKMKVFFYHHGKFTEQGQGIMTWPNKGLVWYEGTVENGEQLFDLNWATWFKKHQNNTQNYICHPTLSKIPFQCCRAVPIQLRVPSSASLIWLWRFSEESNHFQLSLIPGRWIQEASLPFQQAGKTESKCKSPWLSLHFIMLSSHTGKWSSRMCWFLLRTANFQIPNSLKTKAGNE